MIGNSVILTSYLPPMIPVEYIFNDHNLKIIANIYIYILDFRCFPSSLIMECNPNPNPLIYLEYTVISWSIVK